MATTHTRAGAAERLAERTWELNTIDQCLSAANDDNGGAVVVIEALPGLGRSALLAAAAESAQTRGVRVLSARAIELEQDFPFGLALHLYESLWLGLEPSQRGALLEGPAASCADLLEGRPGERHSDGAERRYRLVHGLYALTRNLAASRAVTGQSGCLALLVDDLQWADAESIQFLAYLAARIADLPLVLIAAATHRALEHGCDALAALRRSERAALLRLSPLSPDAVATMVMPRLPEADASLCAALAAYTGGNPALVRAVLDQAHRDELTGPVAQRRVAWLVPDVVIERARHRLDALTPQLRAVAIAAAVLGEEASVSTVSDSTELDGPAVLRAAAELAAEGFLASPGGLAYAAPLARDAVLAGLTPFERAEAHARAARALARGHSDPRRLASHLLAIPPGVEPGVLDLLRQCATAAQEDGDLTLAITLLERALHHQPPQGLRGELLLHLGAVETEAGVTTAAKRLAQARRLTRDPERSAEIALLEAEALYEGRDYARAAAVLEAGMQALQDADEDLARHMKVAYVVAASLVPELQPGAVAAAPSPADEGRAPTPAESVALAHTTWHDAVRGAGGAALRARAQQAWSDGELLESVAPSDPTLPLLIASLMLADELDLADAVLERASAVPHDGHRWLDHGLRALRGWSLYLRGRIAEAEAEVRAATETAKRQRLSLRQATASVAVLCHLQRGHVAPAEAALEALAAYSGDAVLPAAARLALRAQVRLAQHQAEVALSDAQQATAAFLDVFPTASVHLLPGRSVAVAAHLALGQTDAAREMIDADLAQSRQLGDVRRLIRNLRLLGLAVGGHEGLEVLEEAVATGDASSPRLEHIEALVAFGAALRRANRRSAAREPLTRALDLATRGGAGVLAARAHTELIASGARPRRQAVSGIESLTVSQRRVGELAARGLTTRQIAESLFVTAKTVEFHLRQIYQKLGIGSRTELTERFAAEV